MARSATGPLRRYLKIGLMVCFAAHLSACSGDSAEEDRKQRELEAIRAKVRAESVGKKMDSLQTLGGKTYKNIEISKVSDVGISIRHESGVARVSFEELPQAMQDYYHFDPAEKQKALMREKKLRELHEARAASVRDANSEVAKQNRIHQKGEMRKTLRKNLAIMNARVRQLRSEIGSLQSELRADGRATYLNRFDGNIGGISRAPQIREKLEDKREELSSARQKIAAIEEELRN